MYRALRYRRDGGALIFYNTDSAIVVGYVVIWLVFFYAFCSLLTAWFVSWFGGLLFLLVGLLVI
jgi:hypothetical protein